MTTPSSNVEIIRADQDNAKAVWTRPTLEIADINSATEAGGAVSADQDPNQPS
ncbi:hypothetical protein K9B35_16450 [Sphingomonas sp. R647]|uniref:hypothetical protein n=1 Tax=Sphingomonas sp. R647 TaxID=2875233 RepID=UPI001CD3965F|nr:hypothetical protein [Sphingomonas sp. R647]MCA1199560.1 hypothetical protein [Sphingomonas sp. R647]